MAERNRPRDKYFTPFKDMTPEEQMREMFSLGKSKGGGVRLHVKPEPPKVYKKRGPKPRKARPIRHLKPSERTDVAAIQKCESTPLSQDLSKLSVFVPAKFRNKVNGGFGMEEAAQRRPTSNVRLGNAQKVPWDMFTVADISEYMSASYKNVVRVAGTLGYLKRLPGRKWYAPLTREQAKAVMHHVYLGRAGFDRELKR